MPEYAYILEPYKGMKTRYRCPACDNRTKTFSRYIDTVTREHLADHVGRCSRTDNCTYHYTPKQYFADNPNLTKPNIQGACARIVPIIEAKETSYIPNHIFKASLAAYEENCFIKYIITLFGVDIALELASEYHIGSSKHWSGANIFWQVDGDGLVRTGKVMLYNHTTGKRVREPHNHINWVHAIKDKARKPLFPDYVLKQCFFGEHLLNQHPDKIVALVESEKTAIISSIYLPQFIWLATGGKEGINEDKCEVLKSRKVVLYPDLNCFHKWNNIKAMLSQVSISSLLETNATPQEKATGLDLADYLLRYDYRAFTKTPVIHAQQLPKTANQEATIIQPAFGNGNSPQISDKMPSPFEGLSGKVYIPTPGNPKRYAVYDDITAYNQRQHLPDYTDKLQAMKDHNRNLTLDTKNLQLKYSLP